MAVDQGVKDTYLSRVQEAIANRKDAIDRNLEHQATAQFEAAALAGLSAADRVVAGGLGFFGRFDLPSLQAEETRLRSEVNSLQALRAAIKGL